MQFAMKFIAILLLPLGVLSTPVDASANSLGVRNPAAYDTQPAQGSWSSSGQQSGQGGDGDGDEGHGGQGGQGGKSGGSQGASSGGSLGSSSGGSNADLGTVLKDVGNALDNLL